MTPLEELITHGCLFVKLNPQLRPFVDSFVDDATEKEFPSKNLCARVSLEMANNVEYACDFLSISKRTFIESALSEALSKFEEISKFHNVQDL